MELPTIKTGDKFTGLKAWEFIRQVFKVALENDDENERSGVLQAYYCIDNQKRTTWGMCWIIDSMCSYSCITDLVYDQMKAEICSRLENESDYLYANTRNGARQRIKFCTERMAELVMVG